MLDMSHLTTLSDALEQSIIDKDIEQIQQLCEDNSAFIYTIVPQSNAADNEKIKQFILVHQTATQLIRDVHAEMQKQLYQTNKTRVRGFIDFGPALVCDQLKPHYILVNTLHGQQILIIQPGNGSMKTELLIFKIH